MGKLKQMKMARIRIIIATRFAAAGSELYWRCATGISESTVWKSPMLNPLQIPDGTTRNLNTLRKIVASFES